MVPVLVAFLSLATTGIFHTILGTALPAIQVFLGMDTAQTGLFASFAWLGFTAAIFAGGILSDIFEQNLILMLACITVGLSSTFFGISSLVSLNCLLISFLGAGTGVISSSSSALVMKFYPRKEGLMINIHHFFYGIGAITGPLSMGYVLKQGWHWQWVYRAGGIWMLLLAGILAFQKKQPQIHKRLIIDKSFFSLIREKNLLLLVLITLLGCGTYNGVSLWLVSFLKEIRSFPIFQASLGLSLFSTGLAIGRLLSGWLSSKIGNTKVLLLLLSFLSLALLLFLLTTGSAAILGICFMAGLGSSGLYPIALALAGINFPRQSGTTIGILGTSAGIGNMFVPWLMSVVSQVSSLKGGFLIGHFTALIALGLVSLYYRRLSNSEAK